MENTNKTEKMYRLALETSEEVYRMMNEFFKDNEYVVFVTEVNRWHDRVEVRAYLALGHCVVNSGLRELVGSESLSIDFADYLSEDMVERFYDEANSVFRVFARRAKIVKDIIDNKKA